MRYENTSSQFFSDCLEVIREYGNALILAQKYCTAKDIYAEAMRLVESQPVGASFVAGATAVGGATVGATVAPYLVIKLSNDR